MRLPLACHGRSLCCRRVRERILLADPAWEALFRACVKRLGLDASDTRLSSWRDAKHMWKVGSSCNRSSDGAGGRWFASRGVHSMVWLDECERLAHLFSSP